jgi:NAD(P)-dependent dehydrogenase (short-subunit alcohol dehydrogenase family)
MTPTPDNKRASYAIVIFYQLSMDKDAFQARHSRSYMLVIAPRETNVTLKDKRIIILGGTSGIGMAVAQSAAAEGARVVIASSNSARVSEALATLPPGAEGGTIDLTNETAIQAFFAEASDFDHLIYTAGESLRLAPLTESDITQARNFFELRYWGAFIVAKYAHSHIRPGGSIVFTSGMAGARPHSGWSVASSICSAMEGLTRALAVELAPLRVNIVSPGVVKTPLWREMTSAARDALYAGEAQRLPVGHVGEPQEIAEGYLYLMRQTYVTGQTLVIDGGGLLV